MSAALTEALALAILEQGGPVALGVVALWYRLNRLERTLRSRVESIEEDVSANSGVIYDRLLADGAGGAGDGWEPPQSRSE